MNFSYSREHRKGLVLDEHSGNSHDVTMRHNKGKLKLALLFQPHSRRFAEFTFSVCDQSAQTPMLAMALISGKLVWCRITLLVNYFLYTRTVDILSLYVNMKPISTPFIS